MDKYGIFTEIVDLVCGLDDTLNSRTIRLDDTPFKAYGITSLTQIRLAAEVEQRFGITISDSDAFVATSFTRLVDLVEQRLSTGEAGEAEEAGEGGRP